MFQEPGQYSLCKNIYLTGYIVFQRYTLFFRLRQGALSTSPRSPATDLQSSTGRIDRVLELLLSIRPLLPRMYANATTWTSILPEHIFMYVVKYANWNPRTCVILLLSYRSCFFLSLHTIALAPNEGWMKRTLALGLDRSREVRVTRLWSMPRATKLDSVEKSQLASSSPCTALPGPAEALEMWRRKAYLAKGSKLILAIITLISW